MNPVITISGARNALGRTQTTSLGNLQSPSRLLQSEKTWVILPLWVWAVTIALAFWGLFSSNPILTPVALILLTSCVQLLWRHGEPPVLAFACAMQWLQASAIIFYSNAYGLSLEQAGGAPQFEQATRLSLIAVFVLALGMRLALVRSLRSQKGPLLAEALQIHVPSAFIAYLVCCVVASIVERIAFAVPGLAQPIYALITIKWTAFFILAYSIIEQRSGYFLLAAAVCMELAVGFLGFFAGFKSVLFVLLVVILASPFALRGRRLALIVAVVLALFFFGVVWSAIKSEYRDFLNQGSEQQIVVVSVDQRVAKLGDLVTRFNWNNFVDGLDSMILRISYTKLFALTLMNVPDSVPYEHGALWGGALKHVVTPRLFFPGKAALDDSERTNLYTGIQVAGAERGTSMGIGYVAESYVDFGPLGMFAPVFLLGVFFGLIYRVFVINSRSKLICTAIASAIIIFGAYEIETSNIKIVGGNVTVLLVMTTTYLIFGSALRGWLEHRPR